MDPATQQRIAAVPSLDDIARDPRCLSALERASLSALLMRNAVVQSALVAQLASVEDSGNPSKQSSPADTHDQMLTVDEAAAFLRRKPQWIYRNAERLPFVKRITPRSLLCSKNGISRWLAARTA
jgi:hypothetical protein